MSNAGSFAFKMYISHVRPQLHVCPHLTCTSTFNKRIRIFTTGLTAASTDAQWQTNAHLYVYTCKYVTETKAKKNIKKKKKNS